MKKRKLSKKYLALGIIALVVAIGLVSVYSGAVSPSITAALFGSGATCDRISDTGINERNPLYCHFVILEEPKPKYVIAQNFEDLKEQCKQTEGVIDWNCIPDSVFAELPTRASDLQTVIEMIKIGLWPGDYSNFSDVLPDESYFKAPEFYETWVTTGIQFYTDLKLVDLETQTYFVSRDYLNACGWGAYPSELVRVVSGSGVLEASTFWRPGWGVVKFQGMSFVPEFPSEIEINGVQINQNPEQVANWIDVKVEPEYFVFDPVWPMFGKNWVTPVKAIITLKDGIPLGDYAISINAGSSPYDVILEQRREHRLAFLDIAECPVRTSVSTESIHIKVIE